VRVCLLVAVGHGGCWLIAVTIIVGVTPRICEVDILVLSSQELPKKSSRKKQQGGAMQRVFLHRMSMRVLLA